MTNPLMTGRTTIQQMPGIELDFDKQSMKKLDEESAKPHLVSLSQMLNLLSRLVYEKMPEVVRDNASFQSYLYRLAGTVDMVVAKHYIDSMKGHSDVLPQCAIDPTDSGFPIMLRDIESIMNDKKDAQAKLAQLPSDEQLVKDAEFTLFQGSYPLDVIIRKLERDYYGKLQGLDVPDPYSIGMHEEILVKKIKKANDYLMKKDVEKLDDHDNIPRFYTLYFKVTEELYNNTKWRDQLKAAIEEGLHTISSVELKNLAERVESIDGIQLQMIDRFDVGPFYTQFTTNQGAMKALLEGAQETDSVLEMTRYRVFRESEVKKDGFIRSIKGWLSGDEYQGVFSQVMKDPTYMIMPYRLVQKAHNLKLDFENEVKLFGITSKGGLNG